MLPGSRPKISFLYFHRALNGGSVHLLCPSARSPDISCPNNIWMSGLLTQNENRASLFKSLIRNLLLERCTPQRKRVH